MPFQYNLEVGILIILLIKEKIFQLFLLNKKNLSISIELLITVNKSWVSLPIIDISFAS